MSNIIDIKTREVIADAPLLSLEQAIREMKRLETVLKAHGLDQAASALHVSINKVCSNILKADVAEYLKNKRAAQE